MSRHQRLCITLAALSLYGIQITFAAAEDTVLEMATVEANSQSAQIMSTFAQIASSNVEGTQINVYSGIDTLDTMSLSRGLLDMSMVSPVTHDLMTVAGGMFAGESVAAELSRSVQLLMWFPRGRTHFAVRADSEITALDDIKGAKVHLGPHKQSAEFHDAKNWITATTGLVAGQDFEALTGTWAAGAESFLSGDVDVFISACLDPCLRLEALSDKTGIRFIGPMRTDGQATDTFYQAGRVQAELPSKMQSGERSGDTVVSFNTVAGIAAYDATDEQLIYEIVKAYWENLDQTPADQSWADTMDINLATTKRGLIRLHSGAARYYKEIGAIN